MIYCIFNAGGQPAELCSGSESLQGQQREDSLSASCRRLNLQSAFERCHEGQRLQRSVIIAILCAHYQSARAFIHGVGAEWWDDRSEGSYTNMLPDLLSKSKHVITDKNCKADKILEVSSPEINVASNERFTDSSLSRQGTHERYQMLPTVMHYKPGEAPSCSPFHPHHFLRHPHPYINIHGAAGPWRAEYIEPERRCRRGREGADKGW